jgi:hypothetical protein
MRATILIPWFASTNLQDGAWVVIEQHETHEPSLQNEPKFLQKVFFVTDLQSMALLQKFTST